MQLVFLEGGSVASYSPGDTYPNAVRFALEHYRRCASRTNKPIGLRCERSIDKVDAFRFRTILPEAIRAPNDDANALIDGACEVRS